MANGGGMAVSECLFTFNSPHDDFLFKGRWVVGPSLVSVCIRWTGRGAYPYTNEYMAGFGADHTALLTQGILHEWLRRQQGLFFSFVSSMVFLLWFYPIRYIFLFW